MITDERPCASAPVEEHRSPKPRNQASRGRSALPPLKMELVVRLVPLYMVQDTQALVVTSRRRVASRASAGRRGAAATWSTRFSCLCLVCPRRTRSCSIGHRVLSSTKTLWRGVEQWSSVCTADDRTPYRLESLRRAEKKSASYLPSWRAAKLLECGLPDDPPPPPSKSKKKRKLTKGKGRKHAPVCAEGARRQGGGPAT